MPLEELDPTTLKPIRTGPQQFEELDPKTLEPIQADGPGLLSSFVRGLTVRGPENLAGFLDFLGSNLGQMRGQTPPPPPGTPGLAQTIGPPLQQAVGIPPAESTAGRLAEAAGAGVTESLPFVLSGGVGGLGKGLALVSGATGEASTEAARMAGAGPVGQIAASIAGGASPLVLGKGLRAVGRAIGPQVSRKARRQAAEKIAAKALQQRVVDPDEAANILAREAIDEFGGQATTGQALGQVAPGFRDLEQSVRRVNPLLDTTVAGLLRKNRERLQRGFEKIFPGGSQEAARKAFSEADELSAKAIKDAYKGVGNFDGIPTDLVAGKAKALIAEAGEELSRSVSPELRIAADYGSVIEYRKLQNLRSAIGQRIRGAIRDPERAVEVKFLEQLKSSVDETLDVVAGSGGFRAEQVHKLRSAIRLRAERAQQFPKKGVAFKAMTEFEDLGKGFKKILNSPRPADELRNLRTIIGNDPKAWGGVRELMKSEVFGDTFEELASLSGTRKALGQIRKHGAAFDAVFGDGAARRAKSFVERVRVLQSGKLGTSGQAFTTGSNVANPDVLIDVARGDAFGATRKLLQKVLGRKVVDDEVSKVLGEALAKPEIARGLLTRQSPVELHRWTRRIQLTLGLPVQGLSGVVARRENAN
jgi:hypothetical protein